MYFIYSLFFFLVGVILDRSFSRERASQCDPLSPYISILCAHGLPAALSNLEREGLIQGCRVTKNAPSISHLFFTNDSFLFFHSNLRECQHILRIVYILMSTSIKDCLYSYENASEKLINFTKSSISFNENLDKVYKQLLCDFFRVSMSISSSSYLGMPMNVGRSKIASFGFIRDRIWKQVNSWRTKSLSWGGREVLIKSVLQSIPSYLMSLFGLPTFLCDAIHKLLNSFW